MSVIAEPHPCTRCGQTFYFVGPQPAGWVCRYCTPEAWKKDSTDG